jgi:hypothetical protein
MLLLAKFTQKKTVSNSYLGTGAGRSFPLLSLSQGTPSCVPFCGCPTRKRIKRLPAEQKGELATFAVISEKSAAPENKKNTGTQVNRHGVSGGGAVNAFAFVSHFVMETIESLTGAMQERSFGCGFCPKAFFTGVM